MLAVEAENVDMVWLLLAKGADVRVADPVSAVLCLLSGGVGVGVLGRRGDTGDGAEAVDGGREGVVLGGGRGGTEGNERLFEHCQYVHDVLVVHVVLVEDTDNGDE